MRRRRADSAPRTQASAQAGRVALAASRWPPRGRQRLLDRTPRTSGGFTRRGARPPWLPDMTRPQRKALPVVETLRRLVPAVDPRRPRGAWRRLATASLAVSLLGSAATVLGPPAPVAGIGPIPASSLLPSLPIALPTLPLPTLPVPTLPVPTLPPPTVVPTIPPLPTGPPLPVTPPPSTGGLAPSATPGAETAGPSAKPDSSAPTSPGASPAAGGIAAPSGPTRTDGTGGDRASSPFGDFLVPGLLIGVPALALLLIILAQIAGGTAWLPLVNRWLGTPRRTAAKRRRGS